MSQFQRQFGNISVSPPLDPGNVTSEDLSIDKLAHTQNDVGGL